MKESSSEQTYMDYEETSFSLSDYYLIWQRRKWWSIAAFIASIMVSITLCFILPKVYMATTTILVNPKVIPNDYFKSTITISSDKYLNVLTQEIMRSSRLQQTIEKFGLFREQLGKMPMEGILAGMRKNIEIELQKSTGNVSENLSYFSISYKDQEPVTVKNVANYLAASFIEDAWKMGQKQAHETTQFFSKELVKAQTAFQDQENKISGFKGKYLGLLPEQQNTNMQMLTQLLQRKERVNSDIKDAENRRIILQQQINQLVTVGMLTNSAQMPGSTGAISPQQELALAKRQYFEKRNYMTEAHPEMIALKKKISTLEQKLQTEAVTESAEPEKKAVSSPGKSPISFDIEVQITALNRKIDELKGELKKADVQIALYQERIDKAPQVEQELSVIMQEYENAKEEYNNLRKKQLDASQINMLDAEKQQDYFRVLEPATVPEKPEFPKKSKVLLIGLLVGIGAGIGIMILMEFLDNSFHTVKDVEHYLGAQVLASIADHKFAASEPKKARSFS
jgi:polysaccharide chain length determinant protein (PEP-CTERM system associated)